MSYRSRQHQSVGLGFIDNVLSYWESPSENCQMVMIEFKLEYSNLKFEYELEYSNLEFEYELEYSNSNSNIAISRFFTWTLSIWQIAPKKFWHIESVHLQIGISAYSNSELEYSNSYSNFKLEYSNSYSNLNSNMPIFQIADGRSHWYHFGIF